MKAYVLWFGGTGSYGPPEEKDLETFPSIAKAAEEFYLRLRNWSGRTPCVEDDSEMQVFLSDPRDSQRHGNWYPDRRIYLGKRKGVRIERVG